MKWSLSEFKIIEKIKEIGKKGPDKNQLLMLLLVGILLLVIAIPTKGTSDRKNTRQNAEPEAEYRSCSDASYSETQYVYQLESRLQKLLTQIDGAGEVSVMITLHSSSEKVLEKDQKNSEERMLEKDSQGGTRENDNHSLEETTVYRQQDSKEEVPYIRKELSPVVEGVVVVSEGGDQPLVVKNITEAVQALFDIDTHKIRVVKGGR